MSRLAKSILGMTAVAIMAASCGQSARFDAVITDAPSSEVIVKMLDINKFNILDTVKLDEFGKFSYKVDVKKGQPEFVYIFKGEKKLASMILSAGEKVSINADTLGNYTVEGSDESAKLAQVERDYAAAIARMNSLVRRIEETPNEKYAQTLTTELSKEYVDYYRGRVRYIMSNSRSLSVIPVFYQTLGAGLPLFGQTTDAIHFNCVADSLTLVYPDSKYVHALRQEAERRFGYLELTHKLAYAESLPYPEVELPDLQGQLRKLTEVDSKVIMLHFWTATDAQQKMFNLDVLKPIYEEFHSKGFEIYQVALDVNKGLWAQVVKEQKLPWISVCDSRGGESVYAGTYNITALPAFFIIANGELVDGSVVDEKSLRNIIRKNL